MNIAIFASAYHPHTGGVEEACRNLAAIYLRDGHHPLIVTTQHPAGLPARETIDGVDVHRFRFRMPCSSPAGMVRFFGSFPADLTSTIRLLRARNVDVIHVQCAGPNGLYALFAAEITRIPLVVTTQGERKMDAERLYEKSLSANWMLRRLLRRAHYVTACSEHTLNDAKHFAGFPIDYKSRTIYNGIAVGEFDAASPEFTHPRPFILGIGRIVQQKGFDVLINGYARLLRRNPKAPDLIIAGDGPERERLEELVRSLGLTANVRFVGRANRATAVSLFKGCTIFVLPSRYEPQGIVNLEAMACRKPVVAARVGGVPEIVHDGKTGLLFHAENAPALADAIEKLLRSPETASGLGRAGRKFVEERFTWDKIAGEYMEIYRIVSAGPAREVAT